MKMKFIIPIAGALTMALSANTQTWCPSGATWHYTDSSFVSGQPGYRMLEYVQDTTLSGQPCQQMSNTWYRLIAGILDPLVSFKFHTYQAGSVVYCRTELSQPWDTLYWFDAGIGDHWHFAHFTDSDPCDRMLVVDTGTVTISGFPLHYLDYSMDSAGVTVTRRITERLGDSYSFWPQPQCGMNEVKRGLRCYSDNEVGMLATGIVPTCDFTTALPHHEHSDADISAFPTPGGERFTLKLPPGTHPMELFDPLGRLIRTERVISGMPVDVTDLPAQAYLIRLPELRLAIRWVKE